MHNSMLFSSSKLLRTYTTHSVKKNLICSMNLNKTYGSVEHGSSEGLSRVIKIRNGCHKSKQTVGKRRPWIESRRVIKIENKIEEHGVVCVIQKRGAVHTRFSEDSTWERRRKPGPGRSSFPSLAAATRRRCRSDEPCES